MLALSSSQIEAARLDLPYVDQAIYVDNAAVSPVPLRVKSASDLYTDYTVRNLRDVEQLAEPYFHLGRSLAAKLVGSAPERIAYIQNTSHGLSLVALGIDWKDGDNLVIPAQEFPSNYLCWLQLEAQGVEIRRVEAVNGEIHLDDLQAAINDRTKVIAISHVQFYSGFRVDLAKIAELCRKHGTLLIVDGTQSIGALKLDVSQSGVDVLVVSGHKWMLAPRGIGFMSFSERALSLIKPRILGWLSVREPFSFKREIDPLPGADRFEPGTPNGAGIFGLAERLSQIDELNAQSIENRVAALNTRLFERCKQVSLEPLFNFAGGSRSGIFLVRKKGTPSSVLLSRLGAERIFASERSGAIRLSPHYYNTEDEIDQIVEVLAS
jgi:selenocysteine lyase/cysteine desulfurase